MACTQLIFAVPTLVLGPDVAAAFHVAREVASFQIALAIGLLFAAWRPHRAAGMLPLVLALVLCLVATTGMDLAAGRTQVTGELVHGLELMGLVFLWRLSGASGAGSSRQVA